MMRKGTLYPGIHVIIHSSGQGGLNQVIFALERGRLLMLESI